MAGLMMRLRLRLIRMVSGRRRYVVMPELRKMTRVYPRG